MSKSISQIELFDTGVALLAGMMIIPAVYVYSGTEGMASGPSLMFVSLPKVFEAMGGIGTTVGLAFFIMVAFAALTSSVSIMEALVHGCMEAFGSSRKKTSLIIGVLAAAGALCICLGYNIWYFELKLPNGSVGQLLDVMDYISNSFMMPLISLLSCVFIGWVVKPKWIEDEMTIGGHKFSRRRLYSVMIRFVAPIILIVLFLQSTGFIK